MRKFGALLIHTGLVSNDFKKKWDVQTGAFPTNTLHPRALAIHDFRRIREGIVQQDLDAVGAGVKQPAHGPAFQQARNAAGNVGIVAADFVGHQKSRGRGALCSGGQAVFRLEEHGAGVRRKRPHDDGLEFFKFFARDGLFLDFQLGGEEFSQGVALVDGKGRDDSAGIRDGFESLALARGQLHFDSPFGSCLQLKCFLLRKKGRTRVRPSGSF